MALLSENTQKWLWIVLITAALAAIVYVVERDHIPDEYNPFAPLEIADETSFLTSNKISALKGNLDECLNVLKKSAIEFEALPDQDKGNDCGLYNTIHLKQSAVSYGGGITLKCPALVSLMVWEQHALLPLAEEILQQPITKVKHFGTYSCRNINSAKQGKRSQHAYANAIDIAGFVLADGSEISVLNDWGKDNESGEFLSAIHESACDYFSTVLGPDYNQLHHNHFHFDHGSGGLCR